MRSFKTRIGCIAVWLLVAAGAHVPGSAAAQDPDLREILPYLMLVIDTSGSMERLPACSCQTAGCLECLPNCDLPNVSGVPPTDPPDDPTGVQLKKNRWATTLEALTGTFNDFQCTQLARETQNGATYDLGYFTPYHQPWDCPTADSACAFDPTTTHFADYQNNNGILDVYATRVRFGLMTFDGMDTYVGVSSSVPADIFDRPRSDAVHGLWSYGGPKPFNYPGCPYDYMMDTGARGPQAEEGSLISLNSCSGGGAPGDSATCAAWCASCSGTHDAVNREIEQALLRARPFGGTPIAGSLDDLYYHFSNDVDDQFGSCRNRFALLVTDGEPDPDYRNHDCDCASDGTDPARCGGDPSDPRYDPALKKCPYPTAAEAASNLVNGKSSTEPAMIERLFVVGMAVEEQGILDQLHMIADEGCVEADKPCNALFANDLSGLVSNLSAVINSLIEPISRSVPAFAGSRGSDIKQYQISTGFEVATENGAPWTGVIERRRFRCSDNALAAVTLDNAAGDRFHERLNATSSTARTLFTAVPPGLGTAGWSGDPTAMNGHLFMAETGAPCGTSTTGCSNQPLTSGLDPRNFGLSVSQTTTRDDIVAWMRGDPNTPRANRKLGDIYHSSPVIVGSPRFDTTDEAFNLFRQRTDVAGRPLTLYVSSNDGILHAFSVEGYVSPAGYTPARSYAAGEEMWGFVPPLLLDNLRDNLDRHTFSMDGTPVVKNVYMQRSADAQATANQYRTVLITGMRDGGNAYIALDVTNPVDPKFLWQFTDPQMGKTFAQPAIVQARYTVDIGGVDTPRQGAVAILPGGVGTTGALADECDNGATNPTMRQPTTQTRYETRRDLSSTAVFQHRSDVRCWRDAGRALYFVEVATGALLKKIYRDPGNGDARVFPSPLVGTPAAYPADIGAIVSQAYLVDADGVIWRVDLRDSDQHADDPMDGWTARPFHDVFFDAAGEDGIPPPSAGELTYDAPILSVDNDGRMVVIVGTGDNNNFVKPLARNRVVSLTEVVNTAAGDAAPERFLAAMNWEMRPTTATTGPRLMPSELVTGTMALFNGTLFFATFRAVTGADACDLGKGRIHAVHYNQRDIAQANGTGTFAPQLVSGLASGDSTTIINVAPEDAIDNLMLMGLSLTQRPSCAEVDPSTFDVWDQDLTTIGELASPAMYLVAQGSGDTSLLQTRAGSNLGNVELQVNRPPSLSRVLSWATSAD